MANVLQDNDIIDNSDGVDVTSPTKMAKKKQSSAEEVKRENEEADKDLLEAAIANFNLAEEGNKEIRRNALDDNEFYNGKQWDDNLEAAAKEAGEPLRKIPRLHVYTKQIENDLRQQEMSLNITPMDAKGSEKTAEVLQGMVRGIEQMSKAKAQYMQAAGEAGALVLGVGFLKLELDYASGYGFEQQICIKAVKDPMSIQWDPNCQENDFSDADFWFEFKDYPERQFKLAFPKAEYDGAQVFPSSTDENWISNGNIRVARYWYKKERSNYTYLLDDGSIVKEEDIADEDVLDEETHKEWQFGDADKKTIKKMKDALANKRVIRQHREIISCEIHYADMTAAEILHEGQWPSDEFPFVAVTGAQSIVNGKRDIRGVIRHAKDAQMDMNYYQSKIIVRLQQSNKAKYAVDAKSIQGYEQDWYGANQGPGKFVLRYDSVGKDGRNVNPPVEMNTRAQIEDLLALKQSSEIDIQRGMGMFDAGIGATPNEQSGIAIKTLAQHGKNANFHIGENFGQALHTLGHRLINLIPKVYDSARIVKTVSPEGAQEMQAINQIVQMKGESQEIDIAGAAGHYNVAVDIGPGFASKKQEALQGFTALIQADPSMAPLVSDLIAGNLDYPQSDLIRDRLLKRATMQFPGIIETPDQADIPPQVQAQMAQMQQQLQMAQQQLQQISQQAQQMKYVIDTKQTEIQGEMMLNDKKHQGNMQLEGMKREADGQIAQMRQEYEMQIANSQRVLQETKSRLDYEIALRKTETEDRKVMADLVMKAGSQAAELVASEVPWIDKVMDEANANSAPPQTM